MQIFFIFLKIFKFQFFVADEIFSTNITGENLNHQQQPFKNQKNLTLPF